MTQLTTTIKNILNGTKVPTASTSDMKTALTTVYDFVTEMLGTDSSNKSAARQALGVVDSAGLRNLVVNGDFRVNQRAYFGSVTNTANQYTWDRWRVVVQGQNLTVSGTTATAPAGGVEQLVDGDFVEGGDYMVDWEGTATCSINGTTVSKRAIVNLPANVNASLKFFGGTLTKVRLERTVAGAWEYRPYELELLLCMRYFERTSSGNQYLTTVTTTSDFFVPLLVEKRRVPTVLINSTGSTLALGTGHDKSYIVVRGTIAGHQSHAFTYTADAEIHN